jgi:hypothetical protein
MIGPAEQVEPMLLFTQRARHDKTIGRLGQWAAIQPARPEGGNAIPIWHSICRR